MSLLSESWVDLWMLICLTHTFLKKFSHPPMSSFKRSTTFTVFNTFKESYIFQLEIISVAPIPHYKFFVLHPSLLHLSMNQRQKHLSSHSFVTFRVENLLYSWLLWQKFDYKLPNQLHPIMGAAALLPGV